MKKILCKIFGLPYYKKGDRFYFKSQGKFKINRYFKEWKSYDCEFYEIENKSKYKNKRHDIISELEINQNILISKIT